MPSWKTPEARDRLMAALVASLPPNALNYRHIASFYGQGTTYDAIEGQFRTIRKRAAELRTAVDNGSQPEAPPRGSASASTVAGGSGSGGGRRRALPEATGARAGKRAKNTKATTPKQRDGVIGGRVTKSKSITPTNKSAAAGRAEGENAVRGFKQDIESSECSLVGTPVDPFDLPGLDGTCDSFMSGWGTTELSFVETFDGSFGSDASYVFHEA